MSRWLGDVGAMDEVRSRVAGLYDPFETCRLRKEALLDFVWVKQRPA
jgi:hypothetical protein